MGVGGVQVMESGGLQMDTVQFLLKFFATIKIAKSSTRKQQDKYLHASATGSINKQLYFKNTL